MNCVSYRNFTLKVQGDMDAPERISSASPLPGAPLSTCHHQIFGLGMRKVWWCKINLRWGHDEFYTSSDPPESKNPTPSLALLICVLWLLLLIPSMEFGLLFYSLENRLIDTTSFRLYYNLHKYAPDWDSYLDRIHPRGPLQIIGPRPRRYLRYRHYIYLTIPQFSPNQGRTKDQRPDR
jgi:hypothetical protein